MTTLDRLHRKRCWFAGAAVAHLLMSRAARRKHLFGEMASRHFTEILGVCGDDTMIFRRWCMLSVAGMQLLGRTRRACSGERTRLKMEGK